MKKTLVAILVLVAILGTTVALKTDIAEDQKPIITVVTPTDKHT